MTHLLLSVFVVVVGSGAIQPTKAPPPWFAEQLALLTANGGRWEADNTRYRSADEPVDTYVLVWDWGPGRRSIRGRLFGVAGGQDTQVFWEFRQFWDPNTGTVRLQQHGAPGIWADGTITRTPEGNYLIDQMFWSPDGSSWRETHTETSTPTERLSKSARMRDGTWAPGREYVWRLKLPA